MLIQAFISYLLTPKGDIVYWTLSSLSRIRELFPCPSKQHYLSLFFFFCAQMYSIPSHKDIIIYLTTLSWKETCTIILKTVVVENMCIYQEVESLGQI